MPFLYLIFWQNGVRETGKGGQLLAHVPFQSVAGTSHGAPGGTTMGKPSRQYNLERIFLVNYFCSGYFHLLLIDSGYTFPCQERGIVFLRFILFYF